MKKLLSVLLALLLLTALFPLPALGAQDTFTLMVYMCGTDLESQGGLATMDLSEMVKAGLPRGGNVTVYVQTGGTKSWQVQGLTDRQGERWLVSKNGLQLVESLGRVNMGDGSVLADFLKSGIQNYPADRYGLILWDHGAGPAAGICYDEITGDSLDMSELYGALESASKARGYRKLAFVGFDACLMASYEVACHLEPFADYMIASEELEPGTGWSYSDWLAKLSANPGMDIRELGPVIVDGFIRSSLAYNPSEYATLSLTDLGKLPPLRKAMEGLAASLQGQITGGNLMGISRIRQNVRSMGEMFDSASDLLDVTYYAKIYQQFDPASAKAVASALSKAVVYSRHTKNLSNISGLTVLIPYSTRATIGQSLPRYDAKGLFPQHTAFVKGMAQSMNSGSYTFASTAVQQESVASAQSDWFSGTGGATGGLLDWLLSGWEDTPSTQSGQYDEDDFESWFGQEALVGASGQGTVSQGDSDFSLDGFLSSIFGGDVTAADFDEEAFDPEESAPDGDEDWVEDEDQDGAQYEDGEDDEDDQPFAQEDDQNPFAQVQGEYAYVASLTQEELQYLAKAEATLMMDVSDPDFECYVELGYVQDVLVDWTGGKIYGLFDGTWPTLAGQMVCMYDQIANDNYTRSLVPVTVNGEAQYLLVIFDQNHPSGFVMGYTQGYTQAGMPVRGYTELAKGDVVVPQYELLYWDENDEMQSEPFEGDPITVGGDRTIGFAYAAVEGDADYLYGFCLNDIFGDYQFTDFVTLAY